MVCCPDPLLRVILADTEHALGGFDLVPGTPARDEGARDRGGCTVPGWHQASLRRLRRMLGIWWAAAREVSIDTSTIATEEAGSPASHRRESG
jgi:hypothetical protein